MIDRLEHSFDQQRAFVQHASHELRTPLAAIRTNIEVAELDPDVSAEEYRGLLETIKTQTARLTRLSEDLLILSANEEDRRTVEPIDLSAVCREVVEQLEGLAATRGILLRRSGGPVWAMAEPDGIFRCVFNLVDNAIKYSGDGANVTLAVADSPTQATVSVSDTGPGIAADQRDRIFDRFYRIDKSMSRRAGGAGLGLSIVRELAEGMGGSVSVTSQEGLGSTFIVHLALAPAEAFEDAPERMPEASQSAWLPV
jgi:signal transduction histidine kinase